jgi:hypothetical protein
MLKPHVKTRRPVFRLRSGKMWGAYEAVIQNFGPQAHGKLLMARQQ